MFTTYATRRPTEHPANSMHSRLADGGESPSAKLSMVVFRVATFLQPYRTAIVAASVTTASYHHRVPSYIAEGWPLYGTVVSFLPWIPASGPRGSAASNHLHTQPNPRACVGTYRGATAWPRVPAKTSRGPSRTRKTRVDSSQTLE